MEGLSIWSHALAAALFGAIAIWQAQRDLTDRRDKAMVVALALTAFFALSVAITNPVSRAADLGGHARDFGWIAFMFVVWRDGSARKVNTVGLLFAVLVGVLAVQSVVDVVPTPSRTDEMSGLSLLALALLRMTVTIGALLLIHNLYTAADHDARENLRLPMIGVTIMWVFDLNIATMAYLTREWPIDLLAAKGLVLVMIAPVFALAAHRGSNWRIKLSRTVTLQSVSLAAIGIYLVTMVLIVQALELLGGERARLAQVSFVFASLLAALILMPSAKFRAWLRVKISKHLFKHRYDYRSEWVRFTDTLGRSEPGAASLEERVVKALADMLEAPAGLLIVDSPGGMIAQTRWNWEGDLPAYSCVSPAFAAHLAHTGRIIDLDGLRHAEHDVDAADGMVPEWLLSDTRAWVAIPLVHFERLMGIAILTHPPIGRALDWEDLDLLRVAGRQVASYLAEAHGQSEIADMKQFDEFNRRFAFIMHDIKNLASQLGLVARNAERHADNPEFRADMVETLKSSTAKMHDLLARLSQHNKGRREEARATTLADIAERAAAARRRQHPVVVLGERDTQVLAESGRLEQALGQLVQNAIEASPPAEPVTLFVRTSGADGVIEVADKGHGMSAAFIHTQLFKPFASTKETGFGVGAFEARTLILGMGGRLDVSSREGSGTIFTISLPLAQAARVPVEAPASELKDLAA